MSDVSSLQDLRAAWKPLNDAHRSGRRYSDGVHLRIYRCLSWADRAEALTPADPDLSFVLRTIGFNALWGQEYRPGQERPSQLRECTNFLLALAAADPQDRLLGWICSADPMLDDIYANPFFHREFWSEPGSENLAGQETISGKLERWRADRRAERLLEELIRRMLLLRGQLIHGNATLGGKVNRSTVEPAASVMDLLLRRCLEILVLDGGHAADLRWTPVPYPPTVEDLD